MSLTRAKPYLATVGLIALGFAVILILGTNPPRAAAAPCPFPVSSFSAGIVTIQGDPSCAYLDEDFKVHCDGGIIKFDYLVAGVQPIPGNSTGVACGSASGIHVIGNGGDDDIDLSAVTSGNGFTSIARNQASGGFQNDTVTGSPFADVITGDDGRDLLAGGPGTDAVDGGAGTDLLMLRDGGVDTGNCGDGFDAVQADRPSQDSISNCEIADLLPAATPTKRKCKKKKHGHRKCKKRSAPGHRQAAT